MNKLYNNEIYGYQATEIYNLISNIEERENKKNLPITTYCRIAEEFNSHLRKIDFIKIANDLILNCYDDGNILVINDDGILIKIINNNEIEYYLNLSIIKNDKFDENLIEVSKIIHF